MSSEPVLDAETEVLIAQLVADSVEYFANRTNTSNSTWDPSQGPSQIGASYHDYEEPLSSYERHILEGTDIGNANDGWTTPSTLTLSPAGATTRSRQPSLSLDSHPHWDPDAETSEEFKKDQIIAAQHKELIEERVLNGLRMPSPPPISSEGRIAGLGIGCRGPNPESQQRSLSPWATPFVSDAITHRIRCYSRPVRNSSEARSNHNQSIDDQSSGPQIEVKEKRQNSHEDPLEDNVCSRLEPDLQQIFGFPADGQFDHADRPRSRATREDKGKGKGRELSHSPEPSQSPALPKRAFIKRFFDAHKSHLWPATIDLDDLSYDADTGQSIVNIPWPRRDPEQERINDSKIIEIHLGETSDDECEIREMFGKMCIDDLDLEKVLAARRENVVDFDDEDALDDEDLRDILRGGDFGTSDWIDHLRDNERVASGEVSKARNLSLQSW